MALKLPQSMDDLLYFTNRVTPQMSLKAWVYKKSCPKCKKALMGKPLDPKTGRPKIRSTEYECPACKYSEPKVAHEESLQIEAMYSCPKCQKKGESSGPYKRKTYQGVPSYLVECSACGEKIPITKKMKDPKKKKAKATEEVELDE
jgi:hypothetical protein